MGGRSVAARSQGEGREREAVGGELWRGEGVEANKVLGEGKSWGGDVGMKKLPSILVRQSRFVVGRCRSEPSTGYGYIRF